MPLGKWVKLDARWYTSYTKYEVGMEMVDTSTTPKYRGSVGQERKCVATSTSQVIRRCERHVLLAVPNGVVRWYEVDMEDVYA